MNKLLSSFVAGIGSVLVIEPSKDVEYIDAHDITQPSAAEALQGDWVKVGNDIFSAAAEAAKEDRATEY